VQGIAEAITLDGLGPARQNGANPIPRCRMGSEDGCPMPKIYKICPDWMWREAEAAGTFRGAPVDLADGFIHLSTARQLADTATKHFGGQHDLVLVAVDVGALGDALRWEPSRGGDLFPHLYRDLPLGAVASVETLPLGPEGRHLFPAGIAEQIEREAASDVTAAGWVRGSGENFVGLVGPFWARLDGDATRYGFLAERRHLNRGGRVHGGMVMTFADQALGNAALAANEDRPQVTVQLDTHFISGVKEGEFVEARCRVVRKTQALLFMAAELVVAGRVVATSAGVWKMREP